MNTSGAHLVKYRKLYEKGAVVSGFRLFCIYNHIILEVLLIRLLLFQNHGIAISFSVIATLRKLRREVFSHLHSSVKRAAGSIL